MTCYTPEPAEEPSVVTPSSPPEVQSPSRETPNYHMNFGPSSPIYHHGTILIHLDPNQIHTLPDLVMDDDSPYSIDLHSNPSHPHPYPHPQPHPQRQSYQPDPIPGLPPVSHAIHAIAAPGPGHPHHAHADHGHAHRHDLDAPGEVVTHSDDWNRLDTFQTRLEGLQYTLDRTMSKWAREQDPNQEISHHEGLGL